MAHPVAWTAAVLGVLAAAAAAPITETSAMMYLNNYGYMGSTKMDENDVMGMNEGDKKNAVMDFQAFTGLNMTGELDATTMDMMEQPRCGLKDMIDLGDGVRRRRFTLAGGQKWSKRTLTYRVSNYTEQLTRSQVNSEIQRAFEEWSRYSDLSFLRQETGPVDILVEFGMQNHGDNYPFDGRGVVLAHAFFPENGDTHFDDSEQWTVGSPSGTNLFQVSLHEFGHSLGLQHSDTRGAVMFPFASKYDPDYKLHQDDITGIQELYGSFNLLNKGICLNPKIDTIFKNANGITYVFKGDLYYRLNARGVDGGYPKNISQSWVGLPGHIDAAFTYNKKTFFFKGDQFWKYTGKTMDAQYPKLIAENFPNVPNNLDAAFVWSTNGMIYFFKGADFWKFNYRRGGMSRWGSGFVSSWRGVPAQLDAAFTHQGRTYFFKGDQFYRFNDWVQGVEVGFPLPTGPRWFGCESSSSIMSAALPDDSAMDVPDNRRAFPSSAVAIFSCRQQVLLLASLAIAGRVLRV